MQYMKLKSHIRAVKYRSYKGEVGKIAKNVLQRKFKANRPNQKWVTDVTEFNVRGEKLYLSPVMDLFNGEIIAFQTGRRPLFGLVKDMLQKSMDKLKSNEKPLIHQTKDGNIRCDIISNSWQNEDSPKACHVKAIAWIMLQWKASLEY